MQTAPTYLPAFHAADLHGNKPMSLTSRAHPGPSSPKEVDSTPPKQAR